VSLLKVRDGASRFISWPAPLTSTTAAPIVTKEEIKRFANTYNRDVYGVLDWLDPCSVTNVLRALAEDEMVKLNNGEKVVDPFILSDLAAAAKEIGDSCSGINISSRADKGSDVFELDALKKVLVDIEEKLEIDEKDPFAMSKLKDLLVAMSKS